MRSIYNMEVFFIGWLIGVFGQLQQESLWHVKCYIWLLVGSSFFVFSVVLCCYRRYHNYPHTFQIKKLFYGLMAASMGFGWAGWQACKQQEQILPERLTKQKLHVIGVVVDLPQQQDERWRFNFQIEKAHLDVKAVSVPEKVLLSWYGDKSGSPLPQIHAGQRWQFDVRLKVPHGSANPYGFDYELWLWSQKVGATGYVYTGKQAVLPRLLSENTNLSVTSLREKVRAHIFATVADPRLAGLITALTLGDQRAISREDWSIFRQTGVAHLVSISGLHITMFAWLVYYMFSWFWRRSEWLMLKLPAHHAAAIGGLLAALFYALFAGWGIPAQRTVVMLTAVVVLRLAGIRWPWYVVLLWAAVVVTMFDPWALLQAGFWLSFVAVAVLLLLPTEQTNKGIEQLLASLPQPRWRKISRAIGCYLWDLLRIQIRISIVLAPLTLLLFQQVSVFGLLANLFAVPWVTFVMVPLALGGIIFDGLWTLAAWAGDILMVLLSQLADLPGSVWESAVPPWPMTLLAVLAALFAVCSSVRLRYRLIVFPIILPAFLWRPASLPEGVFEVLALDVGQGSAVLIRTAKHSLLYDTGAKFSAQQDAAALMILPTLRALGIDLNLVVVSHADSDHAGGVASVVQAYPKAALLASAPQTSRLWQFATSEKIPCVAGLRWQWDGVEFNVIYPFVMAGAESVKVKSNAQSCVLQVKAVSQKASVSALLTGDIESVQEQALIKHVAAKQEKNETAAIIGQPEMRLQADWMLVPHHGSAGASSTKWIAVVQPRWAVVQAGYANRFGHPHQQVLERYAKYGVSVVNTAKCGAALWRSDRTDEMHCQRVDNRHYWQHVAD